MKDETIQVAADEARRFLRRVTEYQSETEAFGDGSWMYLSKERATVKRSSMDLTRALADMRQGR